MSTIGPQKLNKKIIGNINNARQLRPENQREGNSEVERETGKKKSSIVT